MKDDLLESCGFTSSSSFGKRPFHHKRPTVDRGLSNSGLYAFLLTKPFEIYR
jgi:hypothetical protein